MHSIQQIGMFVEETTELVQRLDQGLLRWHETSEPDELQGLFRAAHTIRSNAGIIGATECARLAQRVESVLWGLRERPIRADDAVLNNLRQSVDLLRQMTHAIASGQANPGLDENSSLWRTLTELADRDSR